MTVFHPAAAAFALLMVLTVSLGRAAEEDELLVPEGAPPEETPDSASLPPDHVRFTKNFPRTTLGFVTPWHPSGKENSLKFAKKFNYIVPFLFHIEPLQVDRDDPSKWTVVVKATTDTYDRKWVQQLHEKHVKVVPIFAFYNWTREVFSMFFLGEGMGTIQHNVVRQIVGAVKDLDADGVALEWGPLPVNEFYYKLEPWIKRIRGSMRKLLPVDKQTFMLSVHPNKKLFGKGQYEALVPHVTHFLMHLYNFTGPALAEGPNAPITWFKDMLDDWQLRVRDDAHDTVVAVLNFFGREYRPDFALDVENYRDGDIPRDSEGNVTRWDVTGEQLALLIDEARRDSSLKLQLNWDKIKKENYYEYYRNGEYRKIYYPTKKSLKSRIKVLRKADALGLGVWNLGTGLDELYDLF